MFIKLKDYYFNLDYVAEFHLNSTSIVVLLKNQAARTFVEYRTKAEAAAAYDALGAQIIEHNKAKMK